MAEEGTGPWWCLGLPSCQPCGLWGNCIVSVCLSSQDLQTLSGGFRKQAPWVLSGGLGTSVPRKQKACLPLPCSGPGSALPCGGVLPVLPLSFISCSSLPPSLALPGSVLRRTDLALGDPLAYAHPHLSPGVRSWALLSPFLCFVPLSVPEWVPRPFVSESAGSLGLSVTGCPKACARACTPSSPGAMQALGSQTKLSHNSCLQERLASWLRGSQGSRFLD